MLLSWLAPLPLTALLTLASCLTRAEKSVTQVATLQEAGTLYPTQLVGIIPLVRVAIRVRWWLVCFLPLLVMATTSSRSCRTV